MRIAVFGTGRVGTSFAHYARHLGADVAPISHEQADKHVSAVSAILATVDIVAAAIPDGVLASWFSAWKPAIGERPAIHFSGALTIPGMRGYHFLYSFPKTPLPADTMAKIAIARDAGSAPFAAIFPGATNPEFEVKAEDRAFYHALAVISGNFAAHVWNETARAFATRFPAAPQAALAFYLAGVVDRFRENPQNSMTGPIARRDPATVAANLAALEADPRLGALYRSFLESAWPDYQTGPAQGD